MSKQIPILLIFFRLFLSPIILVTAYVLRDNSRIYILIIMYLGLLSDILDGAFARKMKISTSKLRRLDSQVDMIFWVSIGVCTWILHPTLIRDHLVSITLIFLMEALCYIISIAKFGKETCTHSFLSKLWGISLLIAFTSMIGFNHAGLPFYLTIILGLISQVDVILITLILPKWNHDIPSTYHAILVRRGIDFKRNELLN
jgi:phosphatidylglycerophosphate synthase